MKKISLFKKLKLFREFKKIIKRNKTELETKFGIRVDNAYRLYTVINIPTSAIGEPYNLRRSDIDKFAHSIIMEYSKDVSNFLDLKGLKEMYGFYEIKPEVDPDESKYAYLIVLGFTLPNNEFRSNEYYDFLYLRLYPIGFGILLLSSLLFFIL